MTDILPKPGMSVLEAKRREFGAFLRSRRERLLPEAVGLHSGIRRRTPGLRREEVALLAGVGTTWYTWLEQGRDVQPSDSVLNAIARALRLDAAEKRHLFLLRSRAGVAPRSYGTEEVDGSLQRLLDSLASVPAYVSGRRWDVLAWNRAAEVVFCDYGHLAGDERNLIHLLFANEVHRSLLIDWKEVALASLAMFRADSAPYLGDPEFERLIDKLRQSSREFEMWWPRQDVMHRLSNCKRIRHPRVGRMQFEYNSFAVTGRLDLDMRLVIYTPLEEEQTATKLESLLQWDKSIVTRSSGSSVANRLVEQSLG